MPLAFSLDVKFRSLNPGDMRKLTLSLRGPRASLSWTIATVLWTVATRLLFRDYNPGEPLDLMRLTPRMEEVYGLYASIVHVLRSQSRLLPLFSTPRVQQRAWAR